MSGRADESGQVVFVLGRATCDRLTPNEIGSNSVDAVKIGLNVVLVLSGLLLTLLVLLHKGKGGGLSDMFGGGMSTTMSGSSVAERNLDRFTVALGLVWGACIIGLNLLQRYSI